MIRCDVKGKIAFTASVLGHFSIVGYSAYSPSKFAARGLTEALQSEFVLYGIAGTTFCPGFVEENKVKTAITLKLTASQPSTPSPSMSSPWSVHGPVGDSAVSSATPPFESEYVR